MKPEKEIKKTIDSTLIGHWVVNEDDRIKIGEVQIVFSENNTIKYITTEKSKFHILTLDYWVEEGFIYTLQPSNQNVEKIKYQIIKGTDLILEFEGLKTKYKKQE